jgi:hypothetical protein
MRGDVWVPGWGHAAPRWQTRVQGLQLGGKEPAALQPAPQANLKGCARWPQQDSQTDKIVHCPQLFVTSRSLALPPTLLKWAVADPSRASSG